MDKPKVPKNKLEENNETKLSVLKNPAVGKCMKVCSVETQRLLNQLKLKREACCTRYSFYQVDKTITDWIRKYHMKGRYAEAIVFMYEHASTALYMEDKDKALARIKRMQSYKKQFGVDCWLVDMGLNRALFFEACARRDVQSILKYIQAMTMFTEMTGSPLVLHMFNYAAGTFCLNLLKMETKQAHEALKILHRFRSTGVTKSSTLEVYSTSQCFKTIQGRAFEHFRVAREALFMDQTPEDVSYYYNDPQEVLYPLLSMAKVKLFLPEFEHSASERKRLALLNMLTKEDLVVAEECLAAFDREKKHLNITPRLNGRYHITKAGLEFRKWQMNMKAHHRDHTSGNVAEAAQDNSTAICSDKNHSCLELAIDYTNKAIQSVRNTEFKELLIARKFRQYLQDCKNKVTSQDKATKPVEDVVLTSSVEGHTELTESSENELKDAVAFLNDLDKPADEFKSPSSNESDVNMDAANPTTYDSQDTEEDNTMKVIPLIICDRPPNVVAKARTSTSNCQLVKDMDILTLNDLEHGSSEECSLSDID